MASENETIADIIAEKRKQATKIEISVWNPNPFQRELISDLRREADRLEAAWKREREDMLKTAMMAKCEVCNEQTHGNAAEMRVEDAIAEDRKRLKYERLHECFWDKRAVQCVVRQMLDEREDLSSIDPVSANRMEYYANLLIGAASDGKSFGNAAAMREALVAWLNAFDKFVQKPRNGKWTQHPCGTLVLTPLCAAKLVDMANAALAESPRNCDVGTPEEQAERFWGYCNAHSCNDCPARGRWRTVYVDGASCKLIQCGVLWAQMPYEAQEGGAAQ